jgi:Fe2+ or Zn2+ uptake regulation protein
MIINKERSTHQKKIIADYLQSVDTHPTAKQVYKAVKKKLPYISLATVYRVLKNMSKKGDSLQLSYKGEIHFDARTSNHLHFICQQCGKIYDVFVSTPSLDKLESKAQKFGKINSYKVNLYGICKKCLKKRRAH